MTEQELETMIELRVTPEWVEPISGYGVNTPVEGGINGCANKPLKDLAKSAAYLKEEIERQQEEIDGMKGRGGYLTAHDFGVANPTQQQLTDYALAQIGQTDQTKIWDGTHVKNLRNGHVWVLTNTPDTEPPIFEWTDDGVDSVGIANNDGVAGIVRGGRGADEVFIDEDGTMKVRGLSALSAVHGMEVDGVGRNLLEVLGVNTIAEAMAEIRRRCNNNAEIDATGIPNFSGLMIGDYIDGLDLSAIAAPAGGTAPQAWNNTYKNNRIVIAGFNTYKNAGDTENAKNHVLFVFRNIVCTARMRASDDNTGGYVASASELRAWLEGANGDGSGAFATGLKAALGGNYLYTIKKCHSRKGSTGWSSYTVWPPTEIEMFGNQTYGDELNYYNTHVHFPIYQRSTVHRVKRRNGSRDWHWLSTPSASSAAYFCSCNFNGYCYYTGASSAGGVAPAFCVA